MPFIQTTTRRMGAGIGIGANRFNWRPFATIWELASQTMNGKRTEVACLMLRLRRRTVRKTAKNARIRGRTQSREARVGELAWVCNLRFRLVVSLYSVRPIVSLCADNAM